MTNPRFIVFLGSDGSGKTTQAIALAHLLRNRGLRVRRVWIRAHHSFSAILGKVLVRFGYFNIIYPQGKNCKQFDVKLLPSMKRFWGFLEFLSAMPWVLFKVKLPLFFGEYVIAERYVVDTVVTVAYFLEDPGFLSGRIAKVLLSMLPAEAFVIHLDAETKTILERRAEEKLDPNYIEFQRKSYFLFADLLNASSIDTSKNDISTTFRIILNDYKELSNKDT